METAKNCSGDAFDHFLGKGGFLDQKLICWLYTLAEGTRDGESESVDGNTRLTLDPLVWPRCSCLASLRSCFFSGPWTRVKGSRVSPGYRLVSCTKIESSQQECRESHSPSLVSGNSRPRLSPNALGKSVQPALQMQFVHWFALHTGFPSIFLSEVFKTDSKNNPSVYERELPSMANCNAA